jgi:hypothetical protein
MYSPSLMLPYLETLATLEITKEGMKLIQVIIANLLGLCMTS